MEWDYLIASITDTCDNRCPGCYRVLQQTLSYQAQHMTLGNFSRIMKLFVGQGGVSIDFVGGEPTLNPAFLDMVELCVQADIEIWIYTNMRSFGREIDLASCLLSLGGDITVVGKLNVPDPSEPEQRRFQAQLIGASEKAVDEMWQGLFNLLTAGFPEGKIGIENLVRKTNIGLASKVYERGLQMGFFVDLEIPTCPVGSCESSFRQWLELFPTKDQMLVCLAEVAAVNERYGIPPCTPMVPHLTGRNAEGVGTGCVSFKQGALLTEADGRVGMCTSGTPLLAEGGRQLNILKDPLEVVFCHPDLLARRQSCAQANIKSGPCATCEHWDNCLAGCAALRETLGLIFNSYPFCYLHDWLTPAELEALFQKRRTRDERPA